MKNKRCYRMLLSLAAVMLCMTAFSIPAYAGGVYPVDGGGTLLVGRGLARESTRLPRFYNRPELVVVELCPGLEEFPAKKE